MAEETQAEKVERIERQRTEAEELSWALRAVVQASGEVDRTLARRLDLRPLDYAAMTHAMNAPDLLGPVELSERLGIATGSATELVDRLEAAGHLRRDRHPNDRRRVSLSPTDTSVRTILEALEPLLTDLDALARDFTPDEQAAIQRYLRSAADRLHRYARRTDGT